MVYSYSRNSKGLEKRWKESMTSGVRISPEKRKGIIKMYLSGYSTPRVAERFGVSLTTVKNILKREGVKRNDRPKEL